MRSLQEKFQISPVLADKDGTNSWEQWNRDTTDPALGKARKSQENVGNWVADSSVDIDTRHFNEMPPGMDINQCRSEQNDMKFVLADESSVTKSTNPEALRNGFKRLSMNGADDQYTGEHMDLFYGDAGGFVERNNYLDRE